MSWNVRRGWEDRLNEVWIAELTIIISVWECKAKQPVIWFSALYIMFHFDFVCDGQSIWLYCGVSRLTPFLYYSHDFLIITVCAV